MTRINYFALQTDLFSLPEVMATFGTIGEFKAEEEELSLHVERMQHYFAANDIMSVEKQRSIMLSVWGRRHTSSYQVCSHQGNWEMSHFQSWLKSLNNTGIQGLQ